MYRAFIVDDDPWVISDILDVLQLKKYGFDEVEEFYSAEEALVAMLSGKAPDLVLSDIRMGDMSGLDMICACRQNHIDSLFVLVSAFNDFSYVSDAFQYSVFDYLLKPVTEESAQRLMVRVCSRLEEKYNIVAPASDAEGQSPFNTAVAYIRSNYTSDISLEEVADACYLSKGYLSMLLKKNLGMSFSRFKNHLRVSEAKRLIRGSNLNITEIAYSVGFNDLNYFSRTFKQIVGVTPQEYQKMSEFRK